MLSRIIQFFSRQKEEPDPMKYLIVGLGNIGPDYHKTRHNIGFDVCDHLAEEFKVSFKDDRLGASAQFKFKGRSFYMLKPSTFMNLSGKAVLYWLKKLNVKPENLLIIVDDLNLDFGKIRLRGKGNDGGHNGLKDINEKLSSTKYARLRIGIGDTFSQGHQVNFVLGKWSDKENEKLPAIIKKAGNTVKSFGTIGLSHTMNQFNG